MNKKTIWSQLNLIHTVGGIIPLFIFMLSVVPCNAMKKKITSRKIVGRVTKKIRTLKSEKNEEKRKNSELLRLCKKLKDEVVNLKEEKKNLEEQALKNRDINTGSGSESSSDDEFVEGETGFIQD